MRKSLQIIISLSLISLIILAPTHIFADESSVKEESITIDMSQNKEKTIVAASISDCEIICKGWENNSNTDKNFSEYVEVTGGNKNGAGDFTLVKIKGKKSGKTQVELEGRYYTWDLGGGEFHYVKKIIKIEVINLEAEKNEEIDNVKNGGTISADMNASEIINYVRADIANNKGQKIKALISNSSPSKAENMKMLQTWKQKVYDYKELQKKQNGLLNKNAEDTYKFLVKLLENPTSSAVDSLIAEFTDTFKNNLDDKIKEIEKSYRYRMALMEGGEPRNEVTFNDVLSDIDDYNPKDTLSDSDAKIIQTKVGTILKYISNIGVVLSVVMIAVLGIKYMIGSVEEKAEYKKDLVPFFVGAVILFGITLIMKILISIGESINNI